MLQNIKKDKTYNRLSDDTQYWTKMFDGEGECQRLLRVKKQK